MAPYKRDPEAEKIVFPEELKVLQEDHWPDEDSFQIPYFKIACWLIAALLIYWIFFTEGSCFGVCSYRTEGVERTYDAEHSEFRVKLPGFEVADRKGDALHVFSLGAMQVIKGNGLDYNLNGSNNFGDDAWMRYMEKDSWQTYYEQFLYPGIKCPASFIHQHSKFYALVGANEEISKKLREYKFETLYGGTPYAFRGHYMSYVRTEMGEDKNNHIYPPTFVNATSNVGDAKMPVSHFLVTGFEKPDTPIKKQTRK